MIDLAAGVLLSPMALIVALIGAVALAWDRWLS